MNELYVLQVSFASDHRLIVAGIFDHDTAYRLAELWTALVGGHKDEEQFLHSDSK